MVQPAGRAQSASHGPSRRSSAFGGRGRVRWFARRDALGRPGPSALLPMRLSRGASSRRTPPRLLLSPASDRAIVQNAVAALALRANTGRDARPQRAIQCDEFRQPARRDRDYRLAPTSARDVRRPPASACAVLGGALFSRLASPAMTPLRADPRSVRTPWSGVTSTAVLDPGEPVSALRDVFPTCSRLGRSRAR
jgi:hypothetical protein